MHIYIFVLSNFPVFSEIHVLERHFYFFKLSALFYECRVLPNLLKEFLFDIIFFTSLYVMVESFALLSCLCCFC